MFLFVGLVDAGVSAVFNPTFRIGRLLRPVIFVLFSRRLRSAVRYHEWGLCIKLSLNDDGAEQLADSIFWECIAVFGMTANLQENLVHCMHMHAHVQYLPNFYYYVFLLVLPGGRSSQKSIFF